MGTDYTSPSSALRVAAVYACVRVIAETLGSLPVVLYRRSKDGRGRERATDDGIFDVLRWRPNAFQTPIEFWEGMVWTALLRGNAYAQIVRNSKGIILELIQLDPDAVKFKRGAFGLVYEYTPTGADAKPQTFQRRSPLDLPQILHLKGPNGKSVIADAADVLQAAKAAQEYGRRALENDATPSMVLTHPGTLDEEAEKRLRESWSAMFGGSRNAGKTAVLEEGMKVEKVSMTAEDMQFLETRKYMRSEIAALFRVPLHMIGDLERATFSNIEQQSLEFVRDTIRPWAVRIEQAIHVSMLSDSAQQRNTYYAEILLDGLLRGDLKSRFDAYFVARQGGWMSINDVREKENQNPIPNGDDYLQPLNMAPVGAKPPAVIDEPAID